MSEQIEKHDCEAWWLEGAGCSNCHPLRFDADRLARLEADYARVIGKIRALQEAHDRDAVENEYFDVLAEAK
jgi:hypothetical protein